MKYDTVGQRGDVNVNVQIKIGVLPALSLKVVLTQCTGPSLHYSKMMTDCNTKILHFSSFHGFTMCFLYQLIY